MHPWLISQLFLIVSVERIQTLILVVLQLALKQTGYKASTKIITKIGHQQLHAILFTILQPHVMYQLVPRSDWMNIPLILRTSSNRVI